MSSPYSDTITTHPKIHSVWSQYHLIDLFISMLRGIIQFYFSRNEDARRTKDHFSNEIYASKRIVDCHNIPILTSVHHWVELSSGVIPCTNITRTPEVRRLLKHGKVTWILFIEKRQYTQWYYCKSTQLRVTFKYCITNKNKSRICFQFSVVRTPKREKQKKQKKQKMDTTVVRIRWLPHLSAFFTHNNEMTSRSIQNQLLLLLWWWLWWWCCWCCWWLPLELLLEKLLLLCCGTRLFVFDARRTEK